MPLPPALTRLVLVLVLAATAAACVKNPVTGKRQLSLVSRQQEIALGQQAKQEVIQGLGLVANPELQQYVSQLGQKLAAASERPDLPWSFEVIDDASVNAFALPGGPIFVTRGILTHLNSEAELAIVLGHEIGHVTAKHAVSMISKQQLAQLGLGIGTILLPENLRGLGQVANAGAGLLFLKYGRDAERQSDELAYRYVLAQGYDPREAIDVFETLGKASGGQGRLPEWLATHPNPENRMAAAQELANRTQGDLSTLAVARERYLAHLDGVIYGENPRNGFFEGQRFLHPGLRFELRFPAGWQTANQAGAVTGVSPKQDAMVQLVIAGKMTPEEAARQFFAQPGIQPAEVGSGTLNTLPMVGGAFLAQTQQGTLGGLVAFVAQEGVTLQLIGLTSAELLPTYQAAFAAAIQSFGPLTDPQALAVQPARLAIVPIPRQMTLAEAHAELQPGIPLETFALINGFEQSEVLPAGTRLKNVVGTVPKVASSAAAP